MQPERFRMWLAAEEYVGAVDLLLPRAHELNRNAADHLKRSAESVLFNIGEGIGAYQRGLKINAYEVAKKEANETRAILRRLVMQGVFTWHEIDRAYNLAGAIIGMLTAAIIALDKRED